MKFIQVVLCLLLTLSVTFACWDCHPDCSGYDECRRENKGRGCRQLAGVSNHEEDDLMNPRFLTEKPTEPAIPINSSNLSSLRGSDANENKDRQLLSSSYFQIRMEHQPHYCWQEEKRERKWCWEAKDSKVEIENCDSGEDDQKWRYRDESGGYVRLSPKEDTGKCLQREGESIRLRTCSGSDSQLFGGFKNNGDRFELIPKGKSDLLSQAHDPKSGEVIELVKKSTARGDHTNYWELINVSTSGSSSSGGGNNNDNNGDGKPRYDYKGRDACTVQNPCGLCEGDCDNHNQCEGNLKCQERDENESFAGCSGGSSDNSASDYCVRPEDYQG